MTRMSKEKAMAILEREQMREFAEAHKHVHDWSDWKEIGRTGDWFHPLIVERKCKTCGASEADEH